MADMDSCFALLGAHQYGIASTGLLTCDHTPCLFLPRQMHKHPFTHQLHTKHVVAVGWELKNSSPMACIIIEMGSMSSPTFDRVGELE